MLFIRIVTRGIPRRFCQINWWMPVFELNRENCMALHPHYFDQRDQERLEPVQLPQVESGEPSQRRAARENRHARPAAPKSRSNSSRRFALFCPVGGAYLFSAAQLHSTVPNTSGRNPLQHRFSHRASRRCAERSGRAERRLRLHWDDDGRLPAGNRFFAPARRSHGAVSRWHASPVSVRTVSGEIVMMQWLVHGDVKGER